jgi:type IV pilus assembly protein PilB
VSAHRFEDEWIVKAAASAAGPEAVEKVRAAGKPRLADALLAGGLAAKDLCAAVKLACRVEALLEAPKELDRLAVSLVPEKVCRRWRVAPLRLDDERVELAMDNPMDLQALSDVQAVTGRTPVPVWLPPAVLESYIHRAFDPETVVYDLLEKFSEQTSVEVIDQKNGHQDGEDDVRAPVIRLVNTIIAKAIHMKASDIHIEHDEKQSAVRLRVDGGLRNLMTLPKYVGSGPVVARVKIMSNLDISDHFRPQDGRAKLRVGAAEVGLRVSTLPTSFGEKVVIRILDKRAAEVPFEKLGFRRAVAERVAAATSAAQGFFLVTGPTGSGKTTSLYSILNRLKSEDTNIVTVEDPIEYKLDGINQVQVQEKQGLTFAAILRSVLRQDPDVILVGEIRDRETADVALQAAQTGHLVFSTLHTNDALSTISRLADMGVERFKMAPGLLGISAQRLVRRLCADCRAELPEGRVPADAAAAMRKDGHPVRMFEPKGCADCDFTGYKGRVTLVELLTPDEDLRRRIGAGESEDQLRKAAEASGCLISMAADAAARVSDGTTTLAEAAPYACFGCAVSAPAAAAAAPVPSAPAPAKEGKRRVLVADDDATIRVIVRSLLEKAGYEVADAPDGAAALQSVAAGAPDLLVVDMNMPHMDGKGVIRGVRESLGLASLPIVVLTSDADDKSQEEALSMGADDYVLKPVKPGILLARVEAALRRGALRG